MHRYLVDHAIRNVWSSPRQDDQFIIAPKRISPPRGALNVAAVMDGTVELPVKKRRTHVFQIGQVDPKSLGLLRLVPHWRVQKWFKFSEAVNAANMEVTIYTANGVNLPRTECYYMFTDERVVIFAVPEQSLFPVNLELEQVYFRLYQNHYFHINSPAVRKLECGFYRPMNNGEILSMENELAIKDQLPGKLKTYVNGVLVDKAQLGDVKLNDYVEWVYDSSIKKTYDWKLSELHQFRSELDTVYKFLLHYQGVSDDTVDYQDDIDIHVLLKPDNGFVKGLYYNRNQEHNHRMITHRDYSIATAPVEALRQKLSDVLNIPSPLSDDIIIRAHIREGGIQRKLVQDNQRIFELYKLNEENRLRALIGTDANVPEWNCAVLEACAYTELMRVPLRKVTMELVENAYGYNASSRILADTPQKTYLNSQTQMATLPYGLAIKSTVYEFDEGGRLLGWRAHQNDDNYDATFEDTRLIEAVLGLPDTTRDFVEGQDFIDVPRNCLSYRVYRCYITNGRPNEHWEDITGTNEYRIENGKIRYNLGGQEHWLKVITDAKILAYDFDAMFNDGMLNFTMMENPTGNPVDDMMPITIQPAQLDIWMNRYKLIRNVDYFVKGAQIYISNKTFLEQPCEQKVQKIHIRMMGLPEKDMELDPIEDTGWILNGSLSNNRIFDLRDDKVLQINVGGSLYHREDLKFAEDRPGSSLLNRLNGKPYQIKDLIVPMRTNTDQDTYSMRRKSQEIDKRVSDYMTLKFGEMESEEISAITARYPLVSIFFSHILYLLRNRLIQLPPDRHMSDLEVRQTCLPYIGLFEYDVLAEEHLPDEKFAYIQPHANETPYTLGFFEYRFYKQVEGLYGAGRINISDYVNMTV